MKAICYNEKCNVEFEIEYEGQKYCSFKCKRARIMRNNRAKKNTERVAARKGDIKQCEFCKDVIHRNPRSSDFHWAQQKFHKGCYKRAYIPGTEHRAEPPTVSE